MVIVRILTVANNIVKFFMPSFKYSRLRIDKNFKKIALNLYPQNFGRALVLAAFLEEFSRLITSKCKMNIAVVGGYLLEPEIKALEFLGVEATVNIFGIDDGTNYLNLNEEITSENDLCGNFDLVLCSQVWEHIWNHESALTNLKKLIKKDGFIWLACPTSNRPHSSPSYYSAGFTSEYLSNNLSRLGLDVKASGQIGTPRNYRATHTLPAWLSVRGHYFPPVYAFSQRSLFPRIIYSLRFLLTTVSLLFSSTRISDDINCATETWILAKR